MESLLLLGRDFPERDRLQIREVGGITAAISAGASVESPGAASKIDSNEDGLLVLLQEDRALLAVADSHFGAQAGHELLTRLEQRCQAIPRNLGGLSMLMVGLTDPPLTSTSGTTLTVCVVDRRDKSGFGLAFGDSDVYLLSNSGARRVSSPNNVYLHLDRPVALELAHRLEFEAKDGLLLLCSDGITECHYRCPETSIGPAHLFDLFQRTGSGREFTEKLVPLALEGVDGNPGGQDNIVVVTM